MNLLARREHSRTELFRKLSAKCEDFDLLNQVLDQLVSDNLLSDSRFAEEFVRYRGNRGFGPLHIQADLKNRGVSDEIISDFIDSTDRHWYEKLSELYQKRYSGTPVSDRKEQGKRMRFLQSRGFSQSQIRRVMDTAD
ncbi:MAG: recombination regulator RecX [Pseudomonadales bacterium]|nr:recombination regulator RecX [Pseudomonadales bacterium]